MQNSTPKSTRHKKLHLVYFVDASSTKSTSISLRLLTAVLFAVIACIATAGLCFYLYFRDHAQIAQSDAYIKELKAGLLAQAAVSQNLLSDGLTKHQTQLQDQIAVATQEVLSNRPAVDSASTEPNIAIKALALIAPRSSMGSSSQNHENDTARPLRALPQSPGDSPSSLGTPLPSPKSPLSSASAGSRVADSSSPGTSASAPPKGSSVSTASRTGSTGSTGASSTAVPGITQVLEVGPPTALSGLGKLNRVKFQNISISEDQQQTTIEFDLAQADASRQEILEGRVCAVAEIKPGAILAASAPSASSATALNSASVKVATIPPKLNLTPANVPLKGCTGGEYVRFTRLRPTELTFPVSREAIGKVVLYFSESGLNALNSHTVIPSNLQ